MANTTLYRSLFTTVDNIETDTKYAANKIVNVTIGKEWSWNKERTFGANMRVVYMGGFRNYAIDEAASANSFLTQFDYSKPLTDVNSDYFRPDIRVYIKRSKEKISRMLSLDIQNVSNQQNQAYKYFDRLSNSVVQKYQLGMVPMINYRLEF